MTEELSDTTDPRFRASGASPNDDPGQQQREMWSLGSLDTGVLSVTIRGEGGVTAQRAALQSLKCLAT